MKRAIVISVVSLLLLISISGCGKKKDETPDYLKNEIAVMNTLINNEYRLLENYKMAKLSLKNQPPFTYYYKEQELRIKQLQEIYQKYEKDFPKNSYTDQIPGFASFKSACKTSYDLEKNAQSMYQGYLNSPVNASLQYYLENFLKQSNTRTSFLKMCSSQ
ncbi:MAG TPA: hypothetical protein ENN73_00230 [Firmicutes bacterium]|nr:hypothetical protein [Bacillota bacterium]